MTKAKPVTISRNNQKRDLESEKPVETAPETNAQSENFNRRDVLKNLAPSVAKSLGQVLKDFKVRTFEVLDKIEKK